MVIQTIGHSTHPIGVFIAILQAHSIEMVVDIRSIPRSRHNPQFNGENLPQSLAAANIGYRHLPGLGGRRRPHRDSLNTGWLNASFRGYADYMQTPEFETALEELIALARDKLVAIMCAEAVEWRCHRSLVADALTARGIAVEHIHSEKPGKPHRITPFAEVTGSRIVYRPVREE